MTDLWQEIDLSASPPTASGNPAPLPARFLNRRGEPGLPVATLANLGAAFGESQPDLLNVGYWPVAEIRPRPAVGYQLASTFERSVDTEAKTVTITYETERMSLSRAKAEVAAAAEAKAQALIDAGFIYAIPGESPADERTYSISDTMQAHMMAIYNRIKGGGSGPMGGVWPDASDTDCEFSNAEWTAFAEAASEYKEGILRNLRVFLRNVRASANTTQLDNCVVSTGVTTGFDDDASGWPTNGS